MIDLDTSDEQTFEALRELARQRMAAIKAERARLQAEELASAKRPRAIESAIDCRDSLSRLNTK